MPIFLLLVAVPIIEIALFIEVGGWLGLWPTLAIVVLTAMIGSMLMRTQGLATIGELQRRLDAGENPAPALAHGAMILMAGMLLLTPGFFTDAIGLALLLAPVRAAVIRFALSRMTMVQGSVHVRWGRPRGPAGPGAAGRGTAGRGTAGPRTTGPGTVEGDYEVVDPEDGGPEGGGPEDGGPEDGAPAGDSGWTRIPEASGTRHDR